MSLPARRAWRWVVSLAALAVIAAGVGAFLVLRGDGEETLTGPAGAPFSVDYPDTWSPLGTDELQAFPNPPLAVLRRDARDGIIVIQQEKPFAGDLNEFVGDLRRELDERLPDFRESAARVIKARAGNAFYYSYVRTRRGTVHLIVIVPAGSRSYVMNGVIRGNADEAAREAGKIITSFDLKRG